MLLAHTCRHTLNGIFEVAHLLICAFSDVTVLIVDLFRICATAVCVCVVNHPESALLCSDRAVKLCHLKPLHPQVGCLLKL